MTKIEQKTPQEYVVTTTSQSHFRLKASEVAHTWIVKLDEAIRISELAEGLSDCVKEKNEFDSKLKWFWIEKSGSSFIDITEDMIKLPQKQRKEAIISQIARFVKIR